MLKNTKVNTGLIMIIAFVMAFQAIETKGAWGDFDPGFGFLGAHIDSLTTYYPTAVALQTDGKILVTGYRLVSGKERFFLRRYLPSGQPDASFGNNGSAISNALLNVNSNYAGRTIALQTNGKIAVAGIAGSYPAIWRFNADGSSDSTIGYGGMRTLSSYQSISTAPLAIQSGKLIVGVRKPENYYLVVIRLNNNGTPDTTFGAAGEVQTVGGHSSLKVESETGKITVNSSRQNQHFGLERFMPDGQSDPTFNFADAYAQFLAPSTFIRLSNQKYVLNGSWYGSPQALPSGSRLTELNADGSLESSLNYYHNPYPFSYTPCPYILAQQQDGKVIATSFGKYYRFDSQLSATSAESKPCSNFLQLNNVTQAVLQMDDKMLVAGRLNGDGNLTLVRVLPD